MAAKKPPLIVVVGETASGKSALGLELAEKFDGEIICADAWTVRRELDIGTAKPSKRDQTRIRHHLLDVVDPCDDFTAAVFKDLATSAIDNISQRGKVPIMVGGTGLYIDGVLFDYGFLPQGNRGKRESLNSLSAEELQNKVKAAGLSLEGVDVRNKRRLIRLLETGGEVPSSSSLRPNTLILGVSAPKDRLKQNIEQRVDTMLKAGLEAEVKQLAEKYNWQCEGVKGIGYREWEEYFSGLQSIEKTRERIIASTLGLAKRQKTWFRRPIYQNFTASDISGAHNKSIHWLNNRGEVVDLATTFLNNIPR